MGSPFSTGGVSAPGSLRLVGDRSLRRWSGGRTLVGGSPLSVIRLDEASARVVGRWLEGEPIPSNGAHRRLADRLLRAGMVHPRYASTRLRADDVTAVIPVRDHAIANVVDGLADVAEVVVVDDGSVTPVPSAAVRHADACGPAAARNAGWRRARTPLVAFLDADTMPEPEWLEPLLRHFEDPSVAAAAPRVYSAPGDTVLSRYEAVRSPLDMGGMPGRVRAGSRIGYVPSAALVVRTEVLRELGGFDERIRVGEDVDLIYRLLDRGHQVRYEPASAVGHAPRTGWRPWLHQRFSYGACVAALAQRHAAATAPVRVPVVSGVVWCCVLAKRSGIGLAVAGGTAVAIGRELGRVGVAPSESLGITVSGHLGAVRLLAGAVTREWAPVAVPLLLATRRGRGALAAAGAVHLLDWVRQRPRLDPVRWTLLRIADDLAYGAGVFSGAITRRTVAPLFPRLSCPARGGDVDEHSRAVPLMELGAARTEPGGAGALRWHYPLSRLLR
jgi:mycofactocin system glycosyltransferase